MYWIYVLSSVLSCTRCSLEDPDWRQWRCCASCFQLRHETKTTLNQHVVIVLQCFDHHSLYHSCCVNSLSFGLVSFLGNAFLVHTAVFTQSSSLVALVRLPTFNTSHYQQASSANGLFSLELRLTRV